MLPDFSISSRSNQRRSNASHLAPGSNRLGNRMDDNTELSAVLSRILGHLLLLTGKRHFCRSDHLRNKPQETRAENEKVFDTYKLARTRLQTEWAPASIAAEAARRPHQCVPLKTDGSTSRRRTAAPSRLSSEFPATAVIQLATRWLAPSSGKSHRGFESGARNFARGVRLRNNLQLSSTRAKKRKPAIARKCGIFGMVKGLV